MQQIEGSIKVNTIILKDIICSSLLIITYNQTAKLSLNGQEIIIKPRQVLKIMDIDIKELKMLESINSILIEYTL